MSCVYCGAEPSQPFSPYYDFPVCRSCGIAQHQALEQIAQMTRPVPGAFVTRAREADEKEEPEGEVVEEGAPGTQPRAEAARHAGRQTALSD